MKMNKMNTFVNRNPGTIDFLFLTFIAVVFIHVRLKYLIIVDYLPCPNAALYTLCLQYATMKLSVLIGMFKLQEAE